MTHMRLIFASVCYGLLATAYAFLIVLVAYVVGFNQGPSK